MAMIILHIAALRNDPFTGVCVAGPEHIRNQSVIAEVALLNVTNCTIDGIENQYIYKGGYWKEDVATNFSKPDIVIFHEVYHIEFAKIAKQLRREGIPYVIIPHGCLVKSAQHKKWLKKKLANTFFFHEYIHRCAALQCLSNNELNNTCFKVPKFIGTNGVNVPKSHKMSFNEESLRIIYIGRLEVIPKGLDLFLQAIRKVKEETAFLKQVSSIDIYGPDVKGRYAEVEGLIVQNGVGDIVTLHHEVKDEKKKKCLLDADIFIQTSRHEGMPMGILEAMGYGLPCIITEGTSLGEITKKYDAGWVADISVDSIAQTIINAISERNLLSAKSLNARKLIKDNFSWDTIASVTIDKYSALAIYKE